MSPAATTASARRPARDSAPGLRLLALDVDGTLTDGAILIGPQGEAMKAFSVRDGFGLALLRGAGLQIAIITGRHSAIVERRAAELGIVHVRQSVSDKARRMRRRNRRLTPKAAAAPQRGRGPGTAAGEAWMAKTEG